MPYYDTITTRTRVIIDNDFGGDPDGLFQLAHHLLSPTTEVRGIIGSKHYENGFYGYPGTAAHACAMATDLLTAMQLETQVAVYEGANSSLKDDKTPVVSAGAEFIVQEAMRDDAKLPLYVVCGAGLTNIASAWLMEPKIAGRIRLVWIGGPEYEGLAFPPPGGMTPEYNLGIDLKAGQVVFNHSDIPLWQIPRDAYRQALASYSELLCRVKDKGALGKFLMERLDDLMQRANRSLGEAYVLGDSPLVLLTALQSSWEPDPSSSRYVIMPAPRIDDAGLYDANPDGRKIRIYTELDVRLMFEDFYAKIALFNVDE
ncbi:nucleoside hydrolase [Candidatus Sumerlaeota bacterium]|nr:nucleoside hydrolase [Candidatus Sumerlaeota bacterium]